VCLEVDGGLREAGHALDVHKAKIKERSSKREPWRVAWSPVPKKRRSRGRSKGAKGKDSIVYCDGCGRPIPRGKAIKVTRPVSVVDPQLKKELEKAGALISRSVVTKTLCVSCAVYQGVRKVRAREERALTRPSR
jgi:small subunit ribosomal protein S26e